MWDRKVQRIMEELLSTEREYVNALGYIREHYFPELERSDVPQDLRGQRGSIFGNLEKLHDFHRHYFLNELESCVNEPFRIGRCFLRHRENFALYALYSKNKPHSYTCQSSYNNTTLSPLLSYQQKQLKLGDRMDLWSYLLKPVQRISKYSLLLQDMVRECDPGQMREIAELKAALEVIHFQLRHGNNLEQGPVLCGIMCITGRASRSAAKVSWFKEQLFFLLFLWTGLPLSRGVLVWAKAEGDCRGPWRICITPWRPGGG
uniref:DH domain-containing protein n=1 Tax=Amphilophus citrinellus TaxID=61819 RepID=A0A3Q0SDE0_AMPCI